MRSATLGKMPCPCCGQPVEVRTDKKARAYVFCASYRQAPGGGIFRCNFHARWGVEDTAAIAKQFGFPAAGAANANNAPGEAHQIEETAHVSEPVRAQAPEQPAAANDDREPGADTGGNFLTGD